VIPIALITDRYCPTTDEARASQQGAGAKPGILETQAPLVLTNPYYNIKISRNDKAIIIGEIFTDLPGRQDYKYSENSHTRSESSETHSHEKFCGVHHHWQAEASSGAMLRRKLKPERLVYSMYNRLEQKAWYRYTVGIRERKIRKIKDRMRYYTLQLQKLQAENQKRRNERLKKDLMGIDDGKNSVDGIEAIDSMQVIKRPNEGVKS
jgi:hypothetical protein